MIDKNKILLDEFEQIEKTLFWRTYCAKIKERIEAMRNILETADTEASLIIGKDGSIKTNKSRVAVNQGEIAGLRWSINLPEVLLSNAKSGASQ